MEMERKEEVFCPSCGRFVGIHEKCPYCGAAVKKRMAVRFFRYGAVVVAVVGLILLYFTVKVIKIPTIKVKNITETMNWAYVRVCGTLTQDAKYFIAGAREARIGQISEANAKQRIKTKGTIINVRTFRGGRSLKIDDGTGTIDVTIWDSLYNMMPYRESLRVGTPISVEGAIGVYKGNLQIRSTAPSEIEIIPASEIEPPPLQITLLPSVTLNEINSLYLTIDDGTGQIRAKSFTHTAQGLITQYAKSLGITVEELLRTNRLPKKGDGIEAMGTLNIMAGQPSLMLQVPERVKFTSALAAAPVIGPSPAEVAPTAPAAGITSIGSITQASVGQKATLKGTITRVRVFKEAKGRSIKISDGTGTIDVLIWKDLYNEIPQRAFLVQGTKIQVSGEIASYKGRPQIKPKSPGDIQILGAAPAAPATVPVASAVAPTAGVTSIGSITQASIGQRATLKGTITDIKVFRSGKGRTIKISDGTGSIDVLIWNSLYNQIPQRANLVQGTKIQVSGEIASYKERLQIKPKSPGDIQIVR
jgi:DNA/RNA endonuclease YhcR with UshA esterase domain